METFKFYSPEQEIKLPLFKEKEVRVFVKRDDFIHPFISGNKWRKLKYILKSAKENHKNTLVTFGGNWSNHLLATAAAGANFGFHTFGFVRGEPVKNPVLALCHTFGMRLQFTSREAYGDKNTLYKQFFEGNPDSVFIPEGGYSREAMQGCAEIAEEFDHSYEAVFCAAGTGATAAGLWQGIDSHTPHSELHVIPVLKGGFIPSEIKKLGVDPKNIFFHENYHFGGYSKTKPELLTFIQDFVSQTGIMIEPVYTGKSFYAAYDLIRKDTFKRGSTLLLLHTGGLTGFLGMYEKFLK